MCFAILFYSVIAVVKRVLCICSDICPNICPVLALFCRVLLSDAKISSATVALINVFKQALLSGKQNFHETVDFCSKSALCMS